MSEEEEMARIDELLAAQQRQTSPLVTGQTITTGGSTHVLTTDSIANAPHWIPYTQAATTATTQGTYIVNEYSNWLNQNGQQMRDVTPRTVHWKSKKKVGIDPVVLDAYGKVKLTPEKQVYNFFTSLKLIK